MSLIIAVDPGALGAIVILEGSMIKHYSNFINWRISDSMLKGVSKSDSKFVIEHIHSAPGGSKTAFALGKNYGAWKAVAEVNGVEFIDVSVQSWQPKILGKFKAGTSKVAAIEYATKKYPDIMSTFTNKAKASGVADAICIAHYAQKFL